MAKDKYVLIDSNIYIDLCFIDIDITDSRVLEELENLLNKRKFFLLLPEVVLLEFEKKFNKKINEIKANIGNVKAVINKGLLIKNHKKGLNINIKIDSRKVQDSLTSALDKAQKDTFKEIASVKQRINKIFKHAQTIQKGLELNPAIIVEGYKMFLNGNKPFKELQRGGNIQPDALIIASAAHYLKSKKYELFFSTGNFRDFCENPDVKDKKKLILDANIKKYIRNIKYYYQPLEMLKNNFAANYQNKIIKEFEEQRVQSIELPVGSEVLSSINFGANSPSLGQLNISGVPASIYATEPSVLTQLPDGRFSLDVNAGNINTKDSAIYATSTCKECGRHISIEMGETAFDGRCFDCMRKHLYSNIAQQ